MTVKVLLKQVREAQKLSLNDLARLTSLSPQYLSRLENGHHNPTLNTINMLCKGLKVQPGDLLVYIEDSD